LEALVNSLSMGLPFEPAEKQALLEAAGLTDRFETLSTLLEIDGVDDGDDEGRSLQ
jgi:Lon protease-like protein